MRSRLCSSCGVTNAATAHECKGCGTKFRAASLEDSQQGDGIDRQCRWEDYGIRCNERGTVSAATTGDGPWYCRTHHAQRFGRRALPLPAERGLEGYGLPMVSGERDYATKARAWLKGKVGEIGNAPTGRNRDWARKILDRWADGESMPDIAVRSACEALGVDLESLQALRRAAA
jgi:hypothetical protein